MTIEELRRDFEEAWLAKGNDQIALRRFGRGDYRYPGAHFSWWAWQEAWRKYGEPAALKIIREQEDAIFNKDFTIRTWEQGSELVEERTRALEREIERLRGLVLQTVKTAKGEGDV